MTPKRNPPESAWLNVDPLNMDHEQQKADKEAAIKHSIDLYHEQNSKSLKGMKNPQIAYLCAEDAFEKNKGRSIVATQGIQVLADIIWQHFNDNGIW